MTRIPISNEAKSQRPGHRPSQLDPAERRRAIEHILRYELYRHRDIASRLSEFLKISERPEGVNRSTWDILFYLMQCYLEGTTPNVTDIYVSTGISKGTAITGIGELELRGAISKAKDASDGRRRRLELSDAVTDILESFVVSTASRITQPTGLSADNNWPGVPSTAQADPLIGLLNRLSHELRTPLTAIVGFAEMIADQSLGPVHPAGYAEYARDIRRAAQALLESLNEHVDSTLAERNHRIPLGELRSVDFENVVDSACRATAPLANRRDVTLRRQWGAAARETIGDVDRLAQAVRKMLEVAIRAADPTQTIDVSTTSDPKAGLILRLTVPVALSNGPGRATLSVPKRGPLIEALALARGIFEAHGGRIFSDGDDPRRQMLTAVLPVYESRNQFPPG